MPEGDPNLILLIGELNGDMKEGQRQRSEQFEILRSIQGQLTELTANFHSHSEHEEEWRLALHERIERTESLGRRLHERVDVVEERVRKAAAECTPTSPEPGPSKRAQHVAVASGGAGLMGLLFGEAIVDWVKAAWEFITKHVH